MDLGVGESKRDQNPIFNGNKLKLGSFAANISYGGAITTAEGTFQPTWPNVVEIGRLVDRSGMEAMVPVARWRGFGGKTDFNGASYESFTWAAGLGSAFKNTGVFATCHMPTIHPIVAAKQATTVDHITNGRFTLNLVCGWFPGDIEMFGAPQREHERRYDYAEEWIEIAKLLWAGEDNFDYDGKFFKIKKGWHRPKPIQAPFPALMNAGGSSRGRDFAAKHCDIIFTAITPHAAFDGNQDQIDILKLRKYAKDTYGRDIKIWTNAYCVIGDTDAEAEAYERYYIEEKGDFEAAHNILGAKALDTVPYDVKYGVVAGYSGFRLVGRADTIAERLKILSQIGIDGVVFTFARYQADLTRLTSEVLPLLVKAGLRKPFKTKA